MDWNKVVGENIAMLRKDRKLTQSDLAKLIGTTEVMLRRYEKGQVQQISLNKLDSCAKVFNIELKDLFDTNTNLTINIDNMISVDYIKSIINNANLLPVFKCINHDKENNLIGDLATILPFANNPNTYCATYYNDTACLPYKDQDIAIISLDVSKLSNGDLVCITDGLYSFIRFYHKDNDEIVLKSNSDSFTDILLNPKKHKIVGKVISSTAYYN